MTTRRCNRAGPSVATYDRLVVSQEATARVVNACELRVNATPLVQVLGPYTVDALAVQQAGADGVALAENTSARALLVTAVDAEVATTLGGTPPQVANYMVTSQGGTALVGALAAGMSAFGDADEGRAGAYQRQLTPTHRETRDALGTLVETNVWRPGEEVRAVAGGGTLTGGSWRVWLTVVAQADAYVPAAS